MDHVPTCCDGLWTIPQHLRDHHILGTDHRDRGTFNVDGNRTLEEVFLQSWTGENDIDGHSGSPMHERKYSRARHEIGISEDEIETAASHHLHESVNRGRLDRGRDVDVGAETRAPPDDGGLCTEQVPRQMAFGHHGRERPEKLSDGQTIGHGAASRKRGGGKPSRSGGPVPWASCPEARGRVVAARRRWRELRPAPFAISDVSIALVSERQPPASRAGRKRRDLFCARRENSIREVAASAQSRFSSVFVRPPHLPGGELPSLRSAR